MEISLLNKVQKDDVIFIEAEAIKKNDIYKLIAKMRNSRLAP
jgi:hypothetical protein